MVDWSILVFKISNLITFTNISAKFPRGCFQSNNNYEDWKNYQNLAQLSLYENVDNGDDDEHCYSHYGYQYYSGYFPSYGGNILDISIDPTYTPLGICRRACMYVCLLHDVQDIECKYGFSECKGRYYTVQQLTAASACGETTVKRGRINGGKLILYLIYFVT